MTLKLKFTTRKINVATVLTATKKQVGNVAMEFAHLFAPLMKIGFKEDVFASQDTILSITSVLNVLQVNSMMFTKESAESNVEPTKSTTLILENAIALKDSTLFKVSALNANLEKFMMTTKENALSVPAKVLTNSTLLPPKHVFVSLNMSVSKEYALTVHLDTTMIVTVTDVSASLVISRKEDFVTPSVPVTKPTSMENANATTEFL